MIGYTIGEIETQGLQKDCPNRTTVSLVDGGISISHYAMWSMGGGLGTYTPAQARELGQLLINAADRWSELNAQVKQAEAEIAAVKQTTRRRIKDFLA